MTLESAEQRVHREIVRLMGSVRNSLLIAIGKMNTEKGLLVADRLNLERIDVLIRQIRGVIQTQGLADVMRTESQELTALYRAAMKEARLNHYTKKFDEEFRTTSRAATARLIQGAGLDIVSIGDRLAQQISNVVRQAVTSEGDRADLILQVSNVLDTTEQQAKTTVTTSLHSFSSSIRVMHAKKAGVKWFAYIGPNDKVIRPWCKRWVNTRFTLEQLAKDAKDPESGRGKKQPLPVEAWRGGWNCRHSLLPLIGPRIKKYPVGPRGK